MRKKVNQIDVAAVNYFTQLVTSKFESKKIPLHLLEWFVGRSVYDFKVADEYNRMWFGVRVYHDSRDIYDCIRNGCVVTLPLVKEWLNDYQPVGFMDYPLYNSFNGLMTYGEVASYMVAEWSRTVN